jgi:anti-sigma factor RsiW
MDMESQLKLQAFLDGELPESDAREVANWVARDKEATALLAELRNTRQALAGFEAVIPLPESREFFWSKVQREIERQESRQPAELQKPSLFAQWRRFIVSAGAIAAVILVALIAVGPPGSGSAVTEAESSMADPGAFTYRDYSAQATLVWLSYPAENEIAEGTTPDTLQ